MEYFAGTRMTKALSNQAKYLSYKAAWERIGYSIEGEYHLEAVALCEGIISDRLVSYLHGVTGKNIPINTPLKSLIDRWRKSAGPISWKNWDDLTIAVGGWRQKRNTVVHGLVKSAP